MTIETADLKTAYAGSFYTITGAGGDLDSWVNGYNGLLQDEGIGVPTQWLKTTGAEVNLYATQKKGAIRATDLFPNDLTILMFPLDGLRGGSLAIFKIKNSDRWFDDLVSNMSTSTRTSSDD